MRVDGLFQLRNRRHRLFCMITLWPPSHTGVNPDWPDRRLPVDDKKLWFYPRAPEIFKSVGRRMVQMRYVLAPSHNSCALGYPVGVFHVDTWSPGPLSIRLVVLFVLNFYFHQNIQNKKQSQNRKCHIKLRKNTLAYLKYNISCLKHKIKFCFFRFCCFFLQSTQKWKPQ